jgi:tRNA A-37 threonylcarbamoyl transferase component Bud32
LTEWKPLDITPVFPDKSRATDRMIELDAVYDELIKLPQFRNAAFSRGPYKEYFVKLCRIQERRFLLRNEAHIAQRLRRYDFCPPLIGFNDFADASCLVYRRVPGVSVRNTIFITKRIIALVKDALDQINEILEKERICQLDPSPNNIIVDSKQGRVWYVDYELCAPCGTETEIVDGFGLSTEDERRVLKDAFQTAGCHYKPAHIAEYGDAFNRYMSDILIDNLKNRRRFGGFLRFFYHRARQHWQRARRRMDLEI